MFDVMVDCDHVIRIEFTEGDCFWIVIIRKIKQLLTIISGHVAGLTRLLRT